MDYRRCLLSNLSTRGRKTIPKPNLWDVILPQAPHSMLPFAGASKPPDPGHSSLTDLHFYPRTRRVPPVRPRPPHLVPGAAKTCLTAPVCAEPGVTRGQTQGANERTAVLLLVPRGPLPSDSVSPGPPASQPVLLYSDAPSLRLSAWQNLHADPEPCLSGPPAPRGHHSHGSGSSTPLRRQEPYLRRSDPRHPGAKPSPAGPRSLLSSLSSPTA